jgi:dienelactone hydrolase
LALVLGLGLLAALFAAQALQAAKVPRIGYLWLGPPGSETQTLAGLRQGFHDRGYVEGRDIGAGFVRSLARPGGNITGLSLSAGTLAAKPLERHFQARRPEGVGPFPAVMLVPGCNGFLRNEEATHYARMADSLRDKGFVVVYVDYLAARGIRRGCGGDVGTEDIAEDILAAAARLRMIGYVRASAISAIGESLGGGGVLAALSTLKSGAPALFDRAIAYFPVCVGIMPWQTPTPLLMLLGALDDITAPGLCKDLVARVTHPGSVEIHVYPQARHGFNHRERPVQRLSDGRSIGYHAEAAASAWAEVERFLRR